MRNDIIALVYIVAAPYKHRGIFIQFMWDFIEWFFSKRQGDQQLIWKNLFMFAGKGKYDWNSYTYL